MAKKPGRPSKYRLEMCERMKQLMAQGASLIEVAADLGINQDTLHKWLHDEGKKAFAEAQKEGLALSEAWWMKLGRDGAAGKVAVQPAIWIFNMKNRFGWRDKRDLDLNAGVHYVKEVSWDESEDAES